MTGKKGRERVGMTCNKGYLAGIEPEMLLSEYKVLKHLSHLDTKKYHSTKNNYQLRNYVLVRLYNLKVIIIFKK